MSDSEATEKPGGAGTEGTIPPAPDGLAANLGDETSNFNPEEDPEADTSDEAGAADTAGTSHESGAAVQD